MLNNYVPLPIVFKFTFRKYSNQPLIEAFEASIKSIIPFSSCTLCFVNKLSHEGYKVQVIAGVDDYPIVSTKSTNGRLPWYQPVHKVTHPDKFKFDVKQTVKR